MVILLHEFPRLWRARASSFCFLPFFRGVIKKCSKVSSAILPAFALDKGYRDSHPESWYQSAGVPRPWFFIGCVGCSYFRAKTAPISKMQQSFSTGPAPIWVCSRESNRPNLVTRPLAILSSQTQKKTNVIVACGVCLVASRGNVPLIPSGHCYHRKYDAAGGREGP